MDPLKRHNQMKVARVFGLEADGEALAGFIEAHGSVCVLNDRFALEMGGEHKVSEDSGRVLCSHLRMRNDPNSLQTRVPSSK